jgi:hypothetical protein
VSDQPGSKAPLVVYGGIFGIGLLCVGMVVIYDCQRDEPYQDAVEVRPGDPPPLSIPPPDDGRPRPKPPEPY